MKIFKFIFGAVLIFISSCFLFMFLTRVFVYVFPNTRINDYGEVVYVMPTSQMLSSFVIATIFFVVSVVFFHKKYCR
ncbi:PEP-CTERM protein-sorting domain-containing protein [Flavobacterium saliperosum]|uniref:Uncharacterized protein n=1 Tax=Flavobacterium saliperosum TaxID=329186 RepID=A0A1G4V2B1_9FLAO|nr:hypothetical protein SAMN02927925_00088 [Flavobacterium saliperosum]